MKQQIKQKVINGVVNSVFGSIGSYKNGVLLSKILGRVKPKAVISRGENKFIFFTPNFITHYRAESLFTKEPGTIAWMDTFKKGEVFYDIGANVGCYAIYAAKARGAQVFAFEPTYTNYYMLNQNIVLNDLDENIVAFCVGLSDSNSFDYVYMPEMELGGAMVNIGSNLDFNRKPFKSRFKQGILAFRLDDFVKTYNLPAANHIKIDVDGLENEIINGSVQVMKNPALKSILIEVNESLESDLKMLEVIKSCGFQYESKTPASVDNIEIFKSLNNYIFRRV